MEESLEKKYARHIQILKQIMEKVEAEIGGVLSVYDIDPLDSPVELKFQWLGEGRTLNVIVYQDKLFEKENVANYVVEQIISKYHFDQLTNSDLWIRHKKDVRKMLGINVIDPQPAPVANNNPAVWDLVLGDMAERDQSGRKKYGTPLQPFNGRDALVDGYQEALDLVVYLRQAIFERDGK